MLSTKVCPVCSREYVPIPGSIYRLKVGTKNYRLCSYKCYRKLQELKSEAECVDEIHKLLNNKGV